MSLGGSNEFIECFAVAEGDSRAVVELAGVGVEVGFAADDGGRWGRYRRMSQLVFSLVSPSQRQWGERKTHPRPCRRRGVGDGPFPGFDPGSV